VVFTLTILRAFTFLDPIPPIESMISLSVYRFDSSESALFLKSTLV
jgi:hypothetical protein